MTFDFDIRSYRFPNIQNSLNPYLYQPKVQAYTMLILSIFTIAFFGWFAIKPTFTTIANLNKQIKDNTLVNQKLQDKINALSQAQDNYQALKPKLEIIFTALPNEISIPSFLKRTQEVASESGVVISTISLESALLSYPKDQINEIKSIGFRLELIGDYGQVQNFIKKITTTKRIATIDRLSLEKSNDKILAAINGKIYYLK